MNNIIRNVINRLTNGIANAYDVTENGKIVCIYDNVNIGPFNNGNITVKVIQHRPNVGNVYKIEIPDDHINHVVGGMWDDNSYKPWK